MRMLALLAVLLASALPAPAAERPRNFIVYDEPKALAAITFSNADSAEASLTDFRGKVVLLNVWATWCGPCRKEMPTLDRLQSELSGPEFEVVALSIDRAGVDVVNKFYSEIGIENLAVYIDDSAAAMRQLGIVGIPSTLLIDRESWELGRLVGPAEWDAPEMIAFLREFVSQIEKGTDP